MKVPAVFIVVSRWIRTMFPILSTPRWLSLDRLLSFLSCYAPSKCKIISNNWCWFSNLWHIRQYANSLFKFYLICSGTVNTLLEIWILVKCRKTSSWAPLNLESNLISFCIFKFKKKIFQIMLLHIVSQFRTKSQLSHSGV